MSNFHKILSDSINGPCAIHQLSIAESICLLSIHNKKYIESVTECGNEFDLYCSDHHSDFRNLSNFYKCSDEELRLIEINNIYAPGSNFLFMEANVSELNIKRLESLSNKGFINFLPRKSDGLNLLQWVALNRMEIYPRVILADFPILITLLNVIHNDVSVADRHFHYRTPQYARYKEALKLTRQDPKAVKSIHEVYASLVIADELITHFQQNICHNLTKTSDTAGLKRFMASVAVNGNTDINSDREIREMLLSSQLNFVLNWLFKAGSLNKANRVVFLRLLTSGPENSEKVQKFLIENNLSL